MAPSRRLHARNLHACPAAGRPFCRRSNSARSGHVFPPSLAGRVCVLAALMAFLLSYGTGIMQFGWMAGIALGWLPALALAWSTAQLLHRCLAKGKGAGAMC